MNLPPLLKLTSALLFLGGISPVLGLTLTDERPLAQLVVQDQGRKKPFPAYAQETLLTLTGRSTWKPAPDAPAVGATQTILSLWLNPESAEEKPLILVNYLPLREALGLPREQKLFRYSVLADSTTLQKIIADARQLKARNPMAKVGRLPSEASNVARRLQILEGIVSGHGVAIVPHPDSPTGAWLRIEDAAQYYPEQAPALQDDFASFRAAYVGGGETEFLKSAAVVESALRAVSPQVYPPPWILDFEQTYQTVHPFRWAWVAYALAAIVFALTAVWQRDWGYRGGWFIILCGFGLHLYGFISRIIISGRAPVTNMYESVVWVAFGCMLFAIILESIYRCRYFLMAAAPAAVLAMILADSQPTVLNSAINPLTPVLRDNFWLTIHVLSITLSYAAFLLALGLGHIILGKILFSKKSLPVNSNLLYLYDYRALQVGVLLLAIGTLLGGVWANYSWGRFWDWDPKETWALIALLSYLILLHGRIAGWWGGFGLAVGSIVGFLSVVMAWYGVNFVLGVGLHSYGFGTGGFAYVVGLVLADLSFAAAAIWRYRQLKSSSRPGAGSSLPGGETLVTG